MPMQNPATRNAGTSITILTNTFSAKNPSGSSRKTSTFYQKARPWTSPWARDETGSIWTKGFDVLGLDISEKGLGKAHQLASANKVKIATRVADLETHQLAKNAYDLIICTYYMQRSLFPQFMDALKPGGMALVETYNLDYLKYKKFKRKYLLEDNELLKIFRDYKIIKYEIYDDGVEAYSSIIVQKPQ